MTEAPTEDEKPPQGDGEEVQEAAEVDFEDADFAVQMTKFDLSRLRTAIDFVLRVVPAYGTTADPTGRPLDADVPPSIDLIRRRALIAAYGLIEREFSPRGGHDEDD